MKRPTIELRVGDALDVLKQQPSERFDTCVTSPPYYRMRDYGVDGQIGLEEAPCEYVDNLVDIFREVRRTLKPEGTLWLNLGDGYNGAGGAGGDYNEGGLREGQRKYPPRRVKGLAPKNLLGMPWRVALALQRDGWILRSDVVWEKPNAFPSPVKDRPITSHEYIFLFAKQGRYRYNFDAVGRLRTVWRVANKGYPGVHFAVFPPELIEPCIAAGASEDGWVLDPFAGSGTTGEVARALGRNALLIDLNPDYVDMARERIQEK